MENMVLKLVAINVLAALIFSGVTCFIPIYLSELGYSESEIGVVFALGSVVLILTPLFSLLADWWGRRRMTQLSILSGSLSYVAYAVNGYVGKILESVYSATWVLKSAIADVCPSKELNSVLANLNGTEILAYSCGMVVGGILIGYLGFSQMFYIAAFFNFFLIFLLPKFKEQTQVRMHFDWNFSKPMLVALSISLVWGVVEGLIAVIIPLIYSEFFKLDIIKIGAFISIIEIIYALPLILLHKRLDRHNAKWLAISAWLLSIPLSALLFMTRDFLPFYLLTLLAAAVYAFFPTAVDRIVVDASRKKYLTFDMSLSRTSFSLGFGIGALLVGPVVGAFGLFGVYFVEIIQGLVFLALLMLV